MAEAKSYYRRIVEFMGEEDAPHLPIYTYVNGELVNATAAGLNAKQEAAVVEALRDAMANTYIKHSISITAEELPHPNACNMAQE